LFDTLSNRLVDLIERLHGVNDQPAVRFGAD
jgi:hypothetical protein